MIVIGCLLQEFCIFVLQLKSKYKRLYDRL
jgi:hypothetical protein